MAKKFNPLLDILDTVTYDGAEDDARAREYLGTVTDSFSGLTPPDLQTISLDDLEYEGDVNPVLLGTPRNVQRGPDVSAPEVQAATAAVERLRDSRMNDIQMDPRLRENQLAALAGLQEVVEGGGLTAQDQAALNRIQNQNARAEQGRRGAILQSMASRGMGGSGMELMAQLQSSQAASDRQAQEGLDVAALAAERKLAAIQALGSQSGSLRGQDFGEAERIAAAQDAIDRFNTASVNQNNQFNSQVLNANRESGADRRLRADLYNRDRAFQADQFDIGNQLEGQRFNAQTANAMSSANRDARQSVRAQNADSRNRSKLYNAQLPQQNFDNRYRVAAGKSGAAGAGVQYYSNKYAAGQAAKGNALGAGVGLAAAAMASDKRAKKNVGEVGSGDIREFLDNLDPKTFAYKDPKAHGEGERPGVMAQDVEKSRLGQLLIREDEEGTKGLDRDATLGAILAALADLNRRLDDKE